MLTKIKFKNDFRCFKKDDVVELRPCINLFVGANGCGKSSLLEVIGSLSTAGSGWASKTVECVTDMYTPIYRHDAEKDNHRMSRCYDSPLDLVSRLRSHGEWQAAIVASLLNDKAKVGTALMDEPETALSVENSRLLCSQFQSLAKKGWQILAATHSLFLISSVDVVYDLTLREWVGAGDFLKSVGIESFIFGDPKRKTRKKRKVGNANAKKTVS